MFWGVTVSLHATCHCSIGYFCIIFLIGDIAILLSLLAIQQVLRKVSTSLDLSDMLDCLLSSVLMIVFGSTSLVESTRIYSFCSDAKQSIILIIIMYTFFFKELSKQLEATSIKDYKQLQSDTGT